MSSIKFPGPSPSKRQRIKKPEQLIGHNVCRPLKGAPKKSHYIPKKLQTNCPLCSKAFSEYIAMIRHLNSEHSDPKPWISCEKENCDKKFLNQEFLSSHLRKEHEG
jgi:uncharacterized Zn-finger protein